MTQRIDRVRSPAGQLPLKAVLWDMDGTLLDSEKIWDVVLADFCGYLGQPMSQELRDSLIGSSGANTMRMIYAEFGLDPSVDERSAALTWMRARTTELFSAELPWRPGAVDALKMVRANGFQTALVTNTKRSLTEISLDTIGREFFDAVVCGDEVEHGKPAPEPYQRAAHLLGLEPSQCLAIEDSPTGTESAENAGCGVLVVPCAIPVATSSRRVFRDSLIGLTCDDLDGAFRRSTAANAFEARMPPVGE